MWHNNKLQEVHTEKNAGHDKAYYNLSFYCYSTVTQMVTPVCQNKTQETVVLWSVMQNISLKIP
jgi:hypothetical protein